MVHINKVALLDRFNFDHPVWFYINSEKECALDHKLNPDEPSFKMFINAKTEPSVLKSPNDDLTYNNMIKWVSI